MGPLSLMFRAGLARVWREHLMMPPGEELSRQATLVDAHVHLHAVFAVEDFLDAAAANFAAASQALGLPTGAPGLLLLAESAGNDAFARLCDGSLDSGVWSLERLAEPESLIARRAGRPPVILVAGRQIVTVEGLEVLALGTRVHFADGDPVCAVLAAARATGALPVLPWGFGKWTGRRAELVWRLFEGGSDLYAGDNGGRPAWSSRPRLLGMAETWGRLVLPGSDPLPFAGEVRKPGSYGFVAEVTCDPDRPFATLRTWLESQTRSPRIYGRRERLPVFLRHQIAMQLRKRVG